MHFQLLDIVVVFERVTEIAYVCTIHMLFSVFQGNMLIFS